VCRPSDTQEYDVKRTLTSKLALAGGVAALALGAAACEVEDDGGLDPGVEDPVLDDTGGDAEGDL
jgi:hypothetical protein